MDELVVKLRLLAKAELILMRLHLRRTVRQAAFYIVAALLAVLAVAMLNISLYLSLSPQLGGAGASLAVAAVDVMLAVIAVVIAARLELGPEEDAANTLRELTMKELVADVERVKEQIADLSGDIKSIRKTVSHFMSPGGFSLAPLLQWLPMLIAWLRGKRTTGSGN